MTDIFQMGTVCFFFTELMTVHRQHPLIDIIKTDSFKCVYRAHPNTADFKNLNLVSLKNIITGLSLTYSIFIFSAVCCLPNLFKTIARKIIDYLIECGSKWENCVIISILGH